MCADTKGIVTVEDHNIIGGLEVQLLRSGQAGLGTREGWHTGLFAESGPLKS